MNRIIKFRIWDKKRHGFLHKIEEDCDIIYADDKWYILGGHKLDDKYIMQQFTGLIDKNDKPVFEGDIISGSTVEYVVELASFGIIRKGIGWTPLGNLFTSRYSPTIIGNNMENPELIIT